MARIFHTPSVSLVLFISLLRTSHSFLVGNEVKGNDDFVHGDSSDMPITDCGDRWSCVSVDEKLIGNDDYYSRKNCACDELCPLFGDCCPEQNSILDGVSPSEDGSQDNGKAAGKSLGGPDFGFDEKQPSVYENNGEDSKTRFGAFQVEKDVKVKNIRGSPQLQNSEIYSRYSLNKDMFTCLYDTDINKFNNLSVVTRCPEHYSDVEVTRLCGNVTDDDMMTRLPVSGTESGVLYRNMFCAMCHEEPYIYWTVQVNCTAQSSLPYDINSTGLPEVMQNKPQCKVQFQPPSDSYRVRPCFSDVKDRCNDTFPTDSARQRDIVRRCENDTEGVQRMVFGVMVAYRNQYCYECNNYNNRDYPDVYCNRLSWETSFGGRPDSNGRGLYSFSILLDVNSNTGSATRVGYQLHTETVERNESVSCDQGHVFDPFQSTCRPVTCGPGRVFVGKTCKKISQSPVDQDITTHNSSIDQIGREENNSFHIPQTVDCSGFFIQLNQTEYQLFQNGTLERVGTNTFYNSSQYYIEDEHLHLCVDYSQNYTRTIKTEVKTVIYSFSFTEAVISTCGIVVSLVALAVTMFVYLSLRALRNIPGQNLLSLVCSLFLADLLLVLGPLAAQEFQICAVIAGVMHYFFLASFLWMNVMAADVWFTFSKAFVKAGDRGKSSKRFLMYSAYSWLTPMAFVLSAALVQILEPDSFLSPHYGVGICWLSSKYALLLFFAAPLLLFLSFNIAFFVISARNISKAKRASSRMLGKEEDGRMGIYVKLTVVMGITWILGFLAALVPDNKVLTYCFVIMNTLQGLFICLSFVFTRKVLTLLKAKFCRTKRTFKVTKSGSTDLTNISRASTANRKMSSASSKCHSSVV